MNRTNPPNPDARKPNLVLAQILLGGGRVVARVLPKSIRRALEDRFFYAVFNVTRVTNDNYGWRPNTAGGSGFAIDPTVDDQETG